MGRKEEKRLVAVGGWADGTAANVVPLSNGGEAREGWGRGGEDVLVGGVVDAVVARCWR
jgi:hypothetical protein